MFKFTDRIRDGSPLHLPVYLHPHPYGYEFAVVQVLCPWNKTLTMSPENGPFSSIRGRVALAAHRCRRIQDDKSPIAAVSYIIPCAQFKRNSKAQKKKKKFARSRFPRRHLKSRRRNLRLAVGTIPSPRL